MLRFWGSAAVAAAVLCALGTTRLPPVSAFDRQLELTNNTRITIVEIQIARVGTDRWEKDILGDELLLPARSIVVDIGDTNGACQFDFKTVFDDGATSIRRNIDVCAVERFAVSHR